MRRDERVGLQFLIARHVDVEASPKLSRAKKRNGRNTAFIKLSAQTCTPVLPSRSANSLHFSSFLSFSPSPVFYPVRNSWPPLPPWNEVGMCKIVPRYALHHRVASLSARFIFFFRFFLPSPSLPFISFFIPLSLYSLLVNFLLELFLFYCLFISFSIFFSLFIYISVFLFNFLKFSFFLFFSFLSSLFFRISFIFHFFLISFESLSFVILLLSLVLYFYRIFLAFLYIFSDFSLTFPLLLAQMMSHTLTYLYKIDIK